MSIAISLGALSVSLLTLYLTFLRKSIRLVGTLAAIYIPDEEMSDPAKVEVAFSNTGNLELLIREVIAERVPRKSELVPEAETQHLPTVIKPGQVVLIQLELPHRYLRDVAGNEDALRLEFEVIDPYANIRGLGKDIGFETGTLDATESAWEPFYLERQSRSNKLG